MDWMSVRSRGLEGLKKYRYLALVLLAGILLMTLPEKKEAQPELRQTAQPERADLQEDLSRILSRIAGAGRVEVLLTQAQGEQRIYQMDEDRSTGETMTDVRRKTVVVSNGSREETGLIRQINPPAYQGAIVLCQGGDNAKIQLEIVEAVAAVTGLPANRITVLKMK